MKKIRRNFESSREDKPPHSPSFQQGLYDSRSGNQAKSISSACYFFFAGLVLGLSFVAGLGFGAGLGLGLSFGAGLGFGADFGLGFGLVAMLRSPIKFFGPAGIYLRNF